jgi:hypothetical protein
MSKIHAIEKMNTQGRMTTGMCSVCGEILATPNPITESPPMIFLNKTLFFIFISTSRSV